MQISEPQHDVIGAGAGGMCAAARLVAAGKQVLIVEALDRLGGRQDLRNEFPKFKDPKIISIRVMRGEWPAQRFCAGFDMPQETPLPNLWHVGDALKDYGGGGTQACADNAKIAAQKIETFLAVT